MKAKNLADVLVHKKAVEARREVSGYLKGPKFRKDLDLSDQLKRSSRRVAALIAEGFGQITDRQTADYYGRARGSAHESHTHLVTARDEEYITDEQLTVTGDKYIEIVKMLARSPGKSQVVSRQASRKSKSQGKSQVARQVATHKSPRKSQSRQAASCASRL